VSEDAPRRVRILIDVSERQLRVLADGTLGSVEAVHLAVVE
jgi:hypothetical protein